jgi:hypothetical protein
MRTVGASAAQSPALPELASVWWRKRASDQTLTRTGRLWTLTAVAHSVPFVTAAAALAALKPVTIPISVVLLVHAWVIPELYAARGARAVKAARRSRENPGSARAERNALGLLGDLLGHRARDLHARTGLVLERGALGVWLVGEAGALLVRPSGRRVHCYCVRATEPGLASSDRICHLLLALRQDESGFATVANLAFAGAPWRLRRRLAPAIREALAAAVAEARKPNH